MKQRSVALSIILTIVTCGFYGIYWFCCITDETNMAYGEAGTSGVMSLLLSIVTCHIYSLFWGYKMGEKIDRIKTNSGYPSSNSGILYLLLVLFGLDIVVYALIQNELNQMNL